MTVEKLIAELSKHDPDTVVCIRKEDCQDRWDHGQVDSVQVRSGELDPKSVGRWDPQLWYDVDDEMVTGKPVILVLEL